MEHHIVVARFAGRFTAHLWRRSARPALLLARYRIAGLARTMLDCSYRRAGGILTATIILACAGQVMSPAALPGVAVKEEPPPVKTVTLADRASSYAWLTRAQRADYLPLVEYLVAPRGFTRVDAPEGTFAAWLRHLPIAPVGTPVTLSSGKIVIPASDPRLAAAIALQPHSGRLLSGPNMLIRLRAEYEWADDLRDTLAFHLTSGHLVAWKKWSEGVRPVIAGKQVTFKDGGDHDDSRSNFCAYLESMFQYTSTLSLIDDTRPIDDATVAAGDMFLCSRSKAPPLVVLDVATSETGEVRLLLGRCGMPAQTFHVLCAADGAPWFTMNRDQSFEVDGIEYQIEHLRRWPIRRAQ